MLTVTDNFGASSTCNATVVVADTTPPQITLPGDLVVSTAERTCASNVAFNVSAHDDCGTTSVDCQPPSGSSFPKGTTLVNCTAVDDAGNQTSSSFNVTVLDNEQPEINYPDNFVVDADVGQGGKSNVTWTVTATDNCGVAKLGCLPPSGSNLPVGEHEIVCTATDASGNSTSCSFSIRVNDPPAVQILKPVDGTLFVQPANLAINAEVTDTDSKIRAVEVFAGSNLIFSTSIAPEPQELATLASANVAASRGSGMFLLPLNAMADVLPIGSVWSNAPAGEHALMARVTDDHGATGTSSVVNVTVLAQPPLAYAPVTIADLDPASGLFLQTIQITNPTPYAFKALRLSVQLDADSLASGVGIGNATGTNNGVPYVEWNSPLAAGQSLDLELAYDIPDPQTMPDPAFTVEVVPADPASPPTGPVLIVDHVVQLTNRVIRVGFTTLSNRIYYVQYSRNLVAWKTVHPPIMGTGEDLHWLDLGPPETETPSESEPNRFYRLLVLP